LEMLALTWKLHAESDACKTLADPAYMYQVCHMPSRAHLLHISRSLRGIQRH
jgi:hypothetical protein